MAAHSAPASSSLGRGGSRLVGDYMFGSQIGSGSFSVVWHARHRLRGTEVAVKEIVMDRLSKKLQDSLLSEIVILKRISHPNIISLYDIIEASGRIYLVLEYCRGGDLSMYLQRNGRVSEATSKHFMQQLAAGLQVLRDNNLIHRDLKPQNLLLTTYDENSVLKIADFGFARSLQPRGLAETLCGSPLYMAPEIMQLQKYDAKADLWSVGAIFFQLVTGKTPFTGSNQIQLLQNIIKSTDLRFPPDNNLSYECIDLCQKLLRRNPVERLTFQEFFDHPFLRQHPLEKSLSRTSSSTRDGFPLIESSPARHSVGSSQDECLPFHLDDESSGQDGSPSVPKGFIGSTYGSSFDSGIHRSPASSPSKIGLLSRNSSHKCESSNYRHDSRPLRGNVGETKLATEQRRLINFASKDSSVVDPLEFIDQEYVLVSGPPVEMAFSSLSISQQRNPPCISESPPVASPKFSAPMQIIGAAARDTDAMGSMESRGSPASGTSQGSMDMGGAIEQPSAHCMTRIRSLRQCASVITELVRDELGSGRRLQAFSIQLVLLAIWKQALHICHAQAASAIEGSPSRDLRIRDSYTGSPEMQHCNADPRQMDAVCSQIEKEFLDAIGRAEDLARELGQADETAEMPDAMEIVYESALSLGRHGAVDEMMTNTERAASRYSKALCMMRFLLVEAPSLVLNPPFSLTNSDRYRLRSYINVLTNRQNQSTSPGSSLLKCEDN